MPDLVAAVEALLKAARTVKAYTYSDGRREIVEWSVPNAPVDALRAALAAHRQRDERAEAAWQSIETAPRSVTVLVAIPGGTRCVAYQTDNEPPFVNTWREPATGVQLLGWPTHWRPLPPPPAAAGPR